MKKKNLRLLYLLPFICLVTALGPLERATGQITVDWSASSDNGLGLQGGLDLSSGSLLRIGYFTIPDLTITINFSDLGFLNSNFVEFGSGLVGQGIGGLDAHWSLSTSAPVSSFAGQRIYLWASDSLSTNILTSTQIGIYYSTNSNWVFPADTGSTAIDLADLTTGDPSLLAPGARVIVGSFGTGTSDVTGAPHFNLALVPDPSTYLLFSLGLGVLAIARRRQS